MDSENDASSETQPPLQHVAPEVALGECLANFSPLEHSPDSRQTLFLWADIFFAMLSEPYKTLDILSQPSQYKPDGSAMFGVGLTVGLAAMVGKLADAAVQGVRLSLLDLIGALLSVLLFWCALALFLKVLSYCFRENVSCKSAAVVTGWAFLPLIFKGPLMCVSLSTPWLAWLMIIPPFWVLLLEVQAFDSVLKLGKARMIILMVAIPPLIMLTVLFWLTVSVAAVVGTLVSVSSNAFN